MTTADATNWLEALNDAIPGEIIVARSSEDAKKAQEFGYDSVYWQSGTAELLAGKSVVLAFHNDPILSTLLPKVQSLKSIAELPDSAQKLADAIEAAQERRHRLVVVQGDAFLQEQIPPREVLLETSEQKSPILYAQSINQIFAWRGTGKTNVALGIAHALACGEQFLKWKAVRPSRVLYVEGELPASQMQERVRQIIGPTNGNLRIVTLDKQPEHEIPSLATPYGQQLLEEALGDAEVLFLDSVSTLFNIATNDEDNWLGIQNWFKKLRSKGICICFLHHSGKSGLQRGSSKSEDLLDISIKLSRPDDYKVTDGLRCNLEFDKIRGTIMSDGEPLEISMQIQDGRAEWLFRSTEDAEFRRASSLFDRGASVRDVASEMGMSVGKIARLRKQWQEKPASDTGDMF